MAPSTSTRNTFILLFYLIFTVVEVFGNSDCFQESFQGVVRCQPCTIACSEQRNEEEDTQCSLKSNRKCFCKPGFYCTPGNNYGTHCHKPCVPCKKGTFSNKRSLEPCKPHTNCAQLGMITLKEGTQYQDRECVNVTTVTPSLPTTTNIIMFTMLLVTNTSIPRTGVTAPLKVSSEQNQSHWLLLLILMLIILSMAVFCMLVKNRRIKTFLKRLGLMQGGRRIHQHCSQTEGDHQNLSDSKSHTLETEIPLGSDGREVKGQSTGLMPQSGTVQQVTMEHNGNGENVSNNVGSIYIYSPGMVILGSNSGDKKEEAGVCNEGVPLIRRPQQESNPPSEEVKLRISAQEEPEEELSLSFPVPATGN